MKKIIGCTATLALLVAFIFSITPSLGATKLPDDRWLYGAAGYARALELQRQLKVQLIVYFYTDWCPYCHTLDNEYLPASAVQEYLRNVVKVRINPKDGTVSTGASAWFYSAGGSQDMKTPELTVLAAADLYRESRLANMYTRLKVVGKIKEGYRNVYSVEASKSTGTPDMLYFDVESGLLLHRDLTRQTSRGPVSSQIYFGDWRKVDGVLLPFRLTQVMPDRTFVITLDEIKLNVPVDETVFQRPSK